MGISGALVSVYYDGDADDSFLHDLGRRMAQQIVGFSPKDVPEMMSQPYLFNQEITVSSYLDDLASNKGAKCVIEKFVSIKV